LSDGAVLFPAQNPAQLYDPARDLFSPIGMMLREQSTAAVLMNGQVLFAGGEPIGRTADAELYNPATRTFVPTASMASPRVWHTLTLLPERHGPGAGGETDSCTASSCFFAGSVATAELYDPAAGAFVAYRQHDRGARDAYGDGAEERQGLDRRRCLVRRHRPLLRSYGQRRACTRRMC
jgi:hypothetical protein